MNDAPMNKELVEVEIARQTVKVPAGGYYDRFRSNPDLDDVARDPAAGNKFDLQPDIRGRTRVC